MEALYAGEEFVDADAPESVGNILARYADIEEHFPEELAGAALPYFVDWLIENVHLVEITAYSDGDAYTIFETMNDRGLSLTPADMLKGYLLANITDGDRRTHASRVWKERVQALAELGKDEDADGIKSWLRSQYAESIRERKRGAEPQDFDLIGTEFHRWVRDHEERLGLTASAEFVRFIERDFAFYSRWYERLRRAGEALDAGPRMRPLQRPAQLHAPVPRAAGAAQGGRRRGHRAAQAARRGGLPRHPDSPPHLELAGHRLLDHAVRDVPRHARHPRQERARAGRAAARAARRRERDLRQQRPLPPARHERPPDPSPARPHDRLRGDALRHGVALHRVRPARARRATRSNTSGPTIPSGTRTSSRIRSEFAEYRNRIGGLLLLPKSFNASYGDLPYAEKRGHYLGQNLLARSLHEQAYDHNPGFRRFIEESGCRSGLTCVQEGGPRRAPGSLPPARRAHLEPGAAGAGGGVMRLPPYPKVQAERRRVAGRCAGALGRRTPTRGFWHEGEPG